MNDDVNVYASAAKGFRLGGINGNLPDGLCGPELTALCVNPAETRLTCGFQYTANAGEAESKGFEVEITAVLAEGLTGSPGVGYTDAKITR